MKLLTFAILLLTVLPLRSQDTITSRENELREYFSEWAELNGDEVDFEELNERLNSLKLRPVHINALDRNELNRLFWLNEVQIENLQRFAISTGGITTIYEIPDIDGFDLNDALILEPYISFEPSDKRGKIPLNLKNLNSQFIIRSQKILQKQTGFIPDTVTGLADYEGNNIKLYSRLILQNRYFSAGLTLEKDAGETLFEGSNSKGFDFTSFHMQLNQYKWIKSLVIGDFKASFGNGLIMGSSFNLGKYGLLSGNMLQLNGTDRYISSNENDFYRGIALTAGIKNWEYSVFYSRKNIDGNIIRKDSLSGKVLEVSSLQTTGYHSTQSEIADEDAIHEEIFGMHLRFKSAYAEFGITGLYNHFGAKISPETDLYNAGYFRGDMNTNLSVDYKIRFSKILFYGENSISKNGAIAIISGLQTYVTGNFTLNALYRNYARDFQALHGNAVGENSRNQNENGITLGINYKPVNLISIFGYTDFFSFPSAIYTADFPTTGTETGVFLTISPNRYFNIQANYRNKLKQQNKADETLKKNILTDLQTQKLKIGLNYQANRAVTLKNTIGFTQYKFDTEMPKYGYYLSQEVNYAFNTFPVKIYARYALFNTDGYESRIYAYESDLLYTFSMSSFYDKGSRYYLMLKFSPREFLDIWIKYALTQYNNKETISSGLYEIQGNVRSEIKVQLIFKL